MNFTRAVLLLIPLFLKTTTAQPTLAAVCNSAPAPAQTVFINADCHFALQTKNLNPTVTLFYSLDGQNSWQEEIMTRLTEPGYESTWQASLVAPASGTVYYYIRAADESGYATHSPFNINNIWPPGSSLLASVAAETTGDAIQPEGPWLDINGAWVSRSNDHFYARLRNNHNSWPTYTFPQPYYIYSLGFVNPEAPTDSFVFVMSYANILTIYTTGLYAINRYTQSYERVGDIEAQTNGNLLSLRCPISRFTADRRFGPWPNSSGYLYAAAVTQAVYPIGGSYVRDTTVPCRFYADRTPTFTVNRNSPPLLTNARVIPDSGEETTPFWFNIRYVDADTNLPTIRTVIVDQDTFNLIPSSHNYASGVIFSVSRTGFAPGQHQFYFQFSDGMANVTTPPDTFTVIGTGIAEQPILTIPDVSLVPNPTHSIVRLIVDGTSKTPLTVTLFDITGSPVATQTVTPGSFLNLRNLPAGTYFVRINTTPPIIKRVVRLPGVR
ncbi:T9SS type A sorting domain-containing protein [candidate division WOR-3 bacterium]|nr:T9SS type A sorting domain-containing protein [candidate division WOR-3 bacterium]